jgi:menaquinone-specific isochorismate synthase
MEPPRSEETVDRRRTGARADAATDAAVTLVSRSIRVPSPSVRSFLGAATAPRTAWSAPGEATVVGAAAAATVTADGPDRFERVREAAERLFADADVDAETDAEAGADADVDAESDVGVGNGPARPRLFGGFAFHHDASGRAPWEGFPGARFVLPRVQVALNGADAWLTVNAVGPEATPEAVERRLGRERDRLAALPDPGPVADAPGIDSRTRTTPPADWRRGVEAAVSRIRAGELRKVVLAQSLDATLESPLSLPDVLHRLGQRYPDCYRFLVEPGPGGPQTSFFGATPERLVSLRGRTVETGALAGTTGRGETSAEDEWLATELLESGKNVHEHELVAEAIREQLDPLAESVTTGERTVRRLATVQHLFTPITAELAADEHVLSLVAALHPTPAVGGLPPARALETIRETEPFDRGWYAAPVGWFDADGRGTFAVAIRSALARERTAADEPAVTLFAGVGVVADSEPDSEWDEVQLKYRPILDELERD